MYARCRRVQENNDSQGKAKLAKCARYKSVKRRLLSSALTRCAEKCFFCGVCVTCMVIGDRLSVASRGKRPTTIIGCRTPAAGLVFLTTRITHGIFNLSRGLFSGTSILFSSRLICDQITRVWNMHLPYVGAVRRLW